MWLEAEWMFSGLGEEVHGGRLKVSGSHIVEVQLGAEFRRAHPRDVVSLDGYFVMPGLIDAHSHLGLVVQPHGARDVVAVVAARIFANLRTALAEGFTTVRDVGGLDGGVGRAMSLGLIRGPKVLPSGPLISQSGGHGDWREPFVHSFTGVDLAGLVQSTAVADGRDEIVKVGRMALRDGARQLKVAVSGGFSSDLDEVEAVEFSEEELGALVGVAAARNTYVTAHAHTSEAVALAARSGVGCIEHGTFADEQTLAEMALRQVPLVATLSTLEKYQSSAARTRMTQAKSAVAEAAFAASCEAVKAALRTGVTVGLGTDMVGPRQSHRAHEVAVRARVTSPLEAIMAATSVNARVLRIARETGSLVTGLVADLVVMDGDPSTDPELFEDPERVRLVVHRGEIARNTLPGTLAESVEKAFSSPNQMD